jgi:hypothetical protein
MKFCDLKKIRKNVTGRNKKSFKRRRQYINKNPEFGKALFV